MKAVALISGGLDSILAAAIVKEQGIDVRGFHFVSVFAGNPEKARENCNKIRVPLKVQKADALYYRMLKNPKHGYGKNLNPCIDCRVHILRKAKEYADKVGAKFIITGEVLGQRPMSQYLNSMNLVEKESGLKGILVRPLSAKHLKETIPEQKKWINRTKLFGITGRSRKQQLELAKKYNITEEYYAGGGCLLTNKVFARRLRDLFEYSEDSLRNIALLCIGRHFRLGNTKIIVGRNEKENEILRKKKKTSESLFEVKGIGSPVTLLIGEPLPESVKLAAQLTARYSDSKKLKAEVSYGKKKIHSSKITDDELEKYRIW
ncbi:MAG: hypothetical protein PHW96_00970 [Candidatus Nanoarchaeia archaeon]|nr:hypothetical protein [Candidatus Nanoarchaeia archaeon]